MAAKLNRGVTLEINRLFQQFFNFSDTLVHAFRIEIINFVSRLECAKENVAGNRVAVFCVQLIDIFLSEKQMAVIEHLEVRLKEFSRDLFIKLLMGVMTFLQEAAH